MAHDPIPVVVEGAQAPNKKHSLSFRGRAKPFPARLVSQDPPKREDDPCADVADAIGRKIMQSGDSLASIFRSWDEDGSGFRMLVGVREAATRS